MLNRIKSEPALVTGLVQAVLAIAVAFGWNLTGEQTAAILAVTAAVLALFVRARVTPVAPMSSSRVDESGSIRLPRIVVEVDGRRIYAATARGHGDSGSKQ